MDGGNEDWSGWSLAEQNEVDSVLDAYQKPDDTTSLASGDTKSEAMYDSSNIGADDDYTFGVYDDYDDSYNEMSDSLSEEDEDSQQENYPVQNTQVQRSPYRFMNGKDGMATCERCGAVGIKHAFYSKSKRFCSLSCSRSFATSQREGKPIVPILEGKVPKKMIAMKRQKSGKIRLPPQDSLPKSMNKQAGLKSFDWGPYLIGSNAEAAPVSSFRHVPMCDSWENISVGMKLELQNLDCDLLHQVYWIATVIRIAGYKALMRYEGFGADNTKDFWVNLCSQDVHPVGWCATSGKPLVPPKTIQHRYNDWKDYLVKRLTGSRTLPSNFYNKVMECLSEHKIQKGMHVEVVDKMCVSAMRVATVDEIIGGRLRLHYDDAKEEGDEFWCHSQSALLHPVGWSQQVGHKLHSTQEYRNQCLGKIAMQKYSSTDAYPDMFPQMKEILEGYKFQVGMKLEAIDPLNLSAICVATVMKVLKNNFLMIGIDGSMAQNGTDWFCYHASSPCIFPVGFCEVNGLNLTPPRGYKGTFRWFDYLKQTKSLAAPVKLFDKEIPKHGFKSGMKIEAVDLMEPRLVCVGTVSKVVGRLLRVHFDGWEAEYDQWVDCESPDMYPVGWCEIMAYHLEGPRIKAEPTAVTIPQPKKRKGKTQIYKGPRKKRKPKMPLTPPPNMKQMPFSFDAMRHRVLNSHLTDAGERPQEVPLLSDPKVSTPSEPTTRMETPDVWFDGPPKLIPSTVDNTSKPVQHIKVDATKPVENTPQNEVKKSEIVNSALLEKLTANSRTLKMNQFKAVALPSSVPIVPTGPITKTTSVQHQQQPLPPGATTETQTLYLTHRHQTIPAEQWTIMDVCQFLKVNDCGPYVEIFHKKSIDGMLFLSLTKEQIVNLTGMKVGSSLKIYELIHVLKSKMAAQQTPVKKP